MELTENARSVNLEIEFLQGRRWKGKTKLFFLDYEKKCSCYSLAVKTTYFTQHLSYLNPKGEDSMQYSWIHSYILIFQN